MGGSRVICWALVLSLPLTLPVGLAALAGGLDAPADAWLGFAYVALVSQFLAFFAWYAALARGGVAKIGQVQLVQPLLTLGWAAALLGEHSGRHAGRGAGGGRERRRDPARPGQPRQTSGA